MKKIKLTQGKYAIVDDDDYNLISMFKWCAAKNRHTFYAQRGGIIDGKRKTIKMHRLILSAKSSEIVDHINHNGLDNRRENIRIVTHSENQWNRRKKKNKKSSKYIGVYKSGDKYKVFFAYKNNKFYLGIFDDEYLAYIEYLRARMNPKETIRKIINELLL